MPSQHKFFHTSFNGKVFPQICFLQAAAWSGEPHIQEETLKRVKCISYDNTSLIFSIAASIKARN